MKRIKQINESKKLIFDGFMRLLDKKNFDDISISEIAEESGVARMTLYRHFNEKEDIILFAFELNLNKAIKIMEQAEEPSLMDLLVFRFKALQDSSYTKILAKHNKLNKLFQTIGKEFVHYFSNLLPDSKDIYENTFMAGGIDAMTELWIQNGMNESPEYMAKKTLTILNMFHQIKTNKMQ